MGQDPPIEDRQWMWGQPQLQTGEYSRVVQKLLPLIWGWVCLQAHGGGHHVDHLTPSTFCKFPFHASSHLVPPSSLVFCPLLFSVRKIYVYRHFLLHESSPWLSKVSSSAFVNGHTSTHFKPAPLNTVTPTLVKPCVCFVMSPSLLWSAAFPSRETAVVFLYSPEAGNWKFHLEGECLLLAFCLEVGVDSTKKF